MKTEYTTQPLGNRCTAIEDNGVRCFLFEGQTHALLVDTGHGKGDLAAFVKTITSLPVMVANTHADPDHTGGNAAFGPALLHPDDTGRFIQFGGNASSTTPLNGGDAIDIGGAPFTVVHAPGHTPGSVALFNAFTGDLVAGDTVQNHRVYMFGEGRDLQAYIRSLRLLASLPAKRVLCSHGDAVLPPSFIPLLREDALALAAGTLPATPVEVFGRTVNEYRGKVGAFLYDG